VASPQPRPPADASLERVAAFAIAFLAGAAVMIVELGAARLVAPYFGQSLYVWTNVIATVLAALAAGNFLGGRAADAWPRRTVLGGLLAIAGLLCALPTLVVPPIAHALLPSSLELEVAFPFLSLGSLVTALVAFAPPVLLLGGVLPFLIKLSVREADRLGSLSGAVYAASTLGSIAGTFLATYVLIAWLGVRGAFFCAAGVLLLSAGAAMLHTRARRPALLMLLGSALGTAGVSLAGRTAHDPDVLFCADSPYQFIRVRRSDPRTIKLELNEGLDSFQSLLVEGEILTGGQYYDYFSLLPFLGARRGSLEVLILGLAGGTIARQMLAIFPPDRGLTIDGVEIDADVVAAGEKYLGLPRDPRLRVIAGVDARCWLRITSKRYDVIIVDAYAQQAYIPFHLSTREFYQSAADHLLPGGVLAMNVGAYSRGDSVLRAISATAASVFERVIACRIPHGRNCLVYAGDRNLLHPSAVSPGSVPPLLEPLLAELAAPGRSVIVTSHPDDLVLTDDRAPIEQLHDREQRRRSQSFLDGPGP
jgi:spermidine synthase